MIKFYLNARLIDIEEYKKVTAELTQEDIVTRLLSSNQIIEPKKYISQTKQTSFNAGLGEYLLNPPKEELSPVVVIENTSYSFIRQGGWKY